MYTLISPSKLKKFIKKIVFVLSFLALAWYPIYKNIYYGRANLQIERHKDFLAKKSEFYNPWQYRIFSPFLVEGTLSIYNATVDKVWPVEEIVDLRMPSSINPKDLTAELLNSLSENGNLKYFLIFVFYRFVFNALTFLFLYYLMHHFIKNRFLLVGAIVFTSLILGNSVNDSDFTLHTYIDVVLYLIAACVIVYKWSEYYIVILSVIGAFNRETSLLIPYLFYISNINWSNVKNYLDIRSFLAERRVILITALSYVLYIMIFIAIRSHYGYVEQTMWKVPSGLPMLKFNLFSVVSIKTYSEMFGTFTILPIICIWYFKRMPEILKSWFVFIVPIWFLVHWWSVVAYQSRLFLVPTLMIFLPMSFYLIDNWNKSNFRMQKV